MRALKVITLSILACAAAPPLHALEATAVRTTEAELSAMSNRVDSSTAAITTVLNELQACGRNGQFYSRGAPGADANGCLPGVLGIPAGTVAAFNLTACPGGWSALPGTAGRFIVGTGTLGVNTYSLGAVGGEASHQLTLNEMPAHRHAFTDIYPKKSTSHSQRDDDDNIVVSIKERDVATEAEGGNRPHENRPPYIALLYCLKN